MSGDIGVDAVDPAHHGREQDFAFNARPNSFCCFTWINGVDLRDGSTADQGRTGREVSSSRLWHPARALGTHAKQGPSTGHSAVGLRQAGKMSPDAEATFHRASCTPGNQVVRASDGSPFRQERRPTRVCRTPRAGSGPLTEARPPPTRPRKRRRPRRPRRRNSYAGRSTRSAKCSSSIRRSAASIGCADARSRPNRLSTTTTAPSRSSAVST